MKFGYTIATKANTACGTERMHEAPLISARVEGREDILHAYEHDGMQVYEEN